MNNAFRPEKSIVELVMALVLIRVFLIAAFGFFALLGASALLAPYLGLGLNEEFFAYRIAGMSRGQSFELALIGGIFSGFMLLVLMAPDKNRSFVQGKLLIVRTCLFRYLELSQYHRDNVVFCILLLFAAYIFSFYYFQFPDRIFVAPDSWTYLAISNVRPLLYPLFIRFLALIADHQTIIIQAHLLIGLVSIAFLAEAIQRVTKNYLLSLGVGILTITNWELFNLSLSVLSDYPFFITFNFALGMSLLAIEKPTRRRLFLFGLVVVISIGVRPTGMVFVGALPALLILSLRHWKRILGYFAMPMFTGMLLLASVNYTVFDYFGFSRYSGYPLMANTLYILEEDTPFEEPGYVEGLYEMMAPYRAELAEQKTLSDIRQNQLANTNIVLGEAWRVLNEYRKNRPDLIQDADTSNQRALVKWFGTLSPLNRKLGEMGVSIYAGNNWSDQFFARLGKNAHLHNPERALELFWAKLVSAWIEPYQLIHHATASLAEVFRSYSVLDFEREDFGFWGDPTPVEYNEVPYLSNLIFSVMSRTIGYSIWYPLVAALSVVGLCAYCLVRVVQRREIPPDIGALTLAGLLIIAYHAGVCLAHVPISRYSIVVLPSALLMLFVPIHFVMKILIDTERQRVGSDLQ